MSLVHVSGLPRDPRLSHVVSPWPLSSPYVRELRAMSARVFRATVSPVDGQTSRVPNRAMGKHGRVSDTYVKSRLTPDRFLTSREPEPAASLCESPLVHRIPFEKRRPAPFDRLTHENVPESMKTTLGSNEMLNNDAFLGLCFSSRAARSWRHSEVGGTRRAAPFVRVASRPLSSSRESRAISARAFRTFFFFR